MRYDYKMLIRKQFDQKQKKGNSRLKFNKKSRKLGEKGKLQHSNDQIRSDMNINTYPLLI